MRSKKILPYILLILSALFLNMQQASAQLSFRDSVRTAFTDFIELSRDDTLNQEIQKTINLYNADTINPALATRFRELIAFIFYENNFGKTQLVPTLMVGKHTSVFENLLDKIAPANRNSDIKYQWLVAWSKFQCNKFVEGLATAKHILNTIRNLHPYNGDYAVDLFQMGYINAQSGLPDSSLFYIIASVDTLQKTGRQQSATYANCFRQLTIIYNIKKDLIKADSCLELYTEIIKKTYGEESAEFVRAVLWVSNANIHLSLNNYIFPLLQKALAVSKKISGENNYLYADCLDEIQGVYYLKGDYLKALSIAKQALEIKQKVYGDNFFDNIVSLHNLATIYDKLGLYDKALPLFEESLALTKKIFGPDHFLVVFDLPYCAHINHIKGEYEKEIRLYQQGFEILKKREGSDSSFYAIPLLYNQSALYETLGQHEKALNALNYALAVEKKLNGINHIRYAKALMLLAAEYDKMIKNKEAENAVSQAIGIYRLNNAESSPEYANCISVTAKIYNNGGLKDSAILFARQSLRIKAQMLGMEHADIIAATRDLADIYLNAGETDSAYSYYKLTVDLSEKVFGKKHPEYARSLVSLSKFYMHGNQWSKAEALLTQANNIEHLYLNNIMATISEAGKFSVISKESYQFSYLPSLLFKTVSPNHVALTQVYENELLVKGLILENMTNMFHEIRSHADSAGLKLFEKWQLYKAFIGQQYLSPLSKRMNNLDSIEQETEKLEEKLSVMFSAFRQQYHSEPVTIKEIIQNLAQSEAAIEFIRFPLYDKKITDSIMYAAMLLLPGDTIPRFIPLFEEKQLSGLLNRCTVAKAGINEMYGGAAQNKMQSSPSSDTLYNLIWRPLEKYLRNIKTVYYSPDGLLYHIAFQALNNGRFFLMDKYNLHQVLSTRSLAFQNRSNKKLTKIEAWGNINYDFWQTNKKDKANISALRGIAVWKALPGTKEEIKKIQSLFASNGINTEIMSDTAATEEVFKRMDTKSPQLLHIATHAFSIRHEVNTDNMQDILPGYNAFAMQQNPMFRTGLILAGGNHGWLGDSLFAAKEDGILTADEISRLDFSNTQLLVLSACETALGDLQGDEGVIGLQRAFKMAGVKQMILSLWQVPDTETSELVGNFYKNLLTGLTPTQALHAAQLTMKEKYSPYYWAAFVLIE